MVTLGAATTQKDVLAGARRDSEVMTSPTGQSPGKSALERVALRLPLPLRERPTGQERWRLGDGNGEKVATSGEGFASRSNAKRAAQNVKGTAPTAQTPTSYGRRTEPRRYVGR